MISTSHANQEDEKKVDFSLQNLDIALGEAIDTCSKQKAWRLEWNHTAWTFHNRMKFLYTKKEIEDDPAAWGVLKSGANLAGIVRTFGTYAGNTAGIVLNFWWRASLASLTNWIKAEYKTLDLGRLTVKRILGAFGQPGGLLWIEDETKSLFFQTLQRAAKYVEALGRGDVESFYWEQMQQGGMASTSQAANPDPMLQLAEIENKDLELSQLDFISPSTIIPGSDVPDVLSEVIAKGLCDPFFDAVRAIVPRNLEVKAGPPKTAARIRVKASEYKKEYELSPEHTKFRKYRDSFMKAFHVEPKASHDFAFQVVDLARVSVTFNQPVDLVAFVKRVEKSSVFEIQSIKNLFRENVIVKPSGYRDLKLLVKFSCPTKHFGHFFEVKNMPETMSFVCELQCILAKWVENKKRTSLSYKLLRADNVNDCLSDFRKYTKEEDDEVQEFQAEKLQHELQQGSFKAGLLLGFRTSLCDIAHLPNLLCQRLNSMEDDEELCIRNVNEQDKGWFPLRKATLFGSMECVQLLVKCKANVNASNRNGNTALGVAAELGEKSIVSFLIAEGATVSFECLYYATASNEAQILRLLLRTAGVSWLSELQLRILLKNAIIPGFVMCLRVLLEYVGDKKPVLEWAFELAKEKNQRLCTQELVNFKRKEGVWADGLLKIDETSQEGDQSEKKEVLEFFKAAQSGDMKKVIYFLERGVDVNVRDVRGATSIFFSACYNRVEITKLLLQLKAKLDFPELVTDPVWIAARDGSATMIELLLTEGADPNKIWNDETPLDMAYRLKRSSFIEILKKYNAKRYSDMRCIEN